MCQDKIDLIRRHCLPLVGDVVYWYETALIVLEDGGVDDWPDMPIRIKFQSGHLISVSWSKLDDLWIAADTSLPVTHQPQNILWKRNGFERLNSIIGKPLDDIHLGMDANTLNGVALNTWTRLVMELDGVWFEIFNGLDENQYELHSDKPAGTSPERASASSVPDGEC